MLTYADVTRTDLKIQEELIQATKYASDLERSKLTSNFIDASRKLVEEKSPYSSLFRIVKGN